MQIIQPSQAFRKEVMVVTGRILQFILVYLLLVLLGGLLSAACILGGILLVLAVPNFMVLMISLGMVGLGLMVMFFLVKFLFAVSRQDRSGYIEVTEAEQPGLFACIRQVARETATPLPKHVYFSPDVNAMVFYDSSFWSMFFPVRKNLVIGLGLVNSLNVGELKAVLAHEFGHFSQSSMKLGSYVYQVNRIIFNMLYENTGYSRFLTAWARISGYFAFFAGITVKVIGAIQWVLRKAYAFVNKSYMSLSREMEFHADAVAAASSGGNNLVTALRRIELADSCYDSVLNTCNEWLRKDELIENFYPAQRFVMLDIASRFDMELRDGLPDVPAEHDLFRQFTRVNIKDQWASHPPTEERTAALKALNMDAPPDTRDAWSLIREPQNVQKAMTELVYANASVELSGKSVGDEKLFAEKYREVNIAYSFPPDYQGCYDGRRLGELDIDALVSGNACGETDPAGWRQWCTRELAGLTSRISSARQDLGLLQAMEEKELEVNSFDFEGKRYRAADAPDIKARIERDMEAWQQEILDFDRRMFCAAVQAVGGPADNNPVVARYRHYFAARARFDAFLDTSYKVFDLLSPILNGEALEIEKILQTISGFKTQYEPVMKDLFRQFRAEGLYETATETREKLDLFLEAEFVYFNDKSFFEAELDTVTLLLRETQDLLQESLFRDLRALLFDQLEWLNSPVPA